MNVFEALKTRKSVRGYLETEVEEEKLKSILSYGNQAPNAGPVHISVIRNRELLDDINNAAEKYALSSDNDYLKKRFSISGYKATYGAPVLVVLSSPNGGAQNCACAATNMCIAATGYELGSCYLGAFLFAFTEKPELLKTIGVPDGFIPQCGLILGYKSIKQIPSSKKGEKENINFVD